MKTQLWRGMTTAFLLAAISPAFAQTNSKHDLTSPVESKEAAHQRMRDLADEIARLRSIGASARQIDVLQGHYDAISASLGGDQPSRQSAPGTFAPVAQSTPQQLIAPTCGGGSITPVNFAGTTGPILPTAPAPTVFTASVSGLGTYLWDLDLTTFITHTSCTDLDITLTSPAGTTVTITTDNGGTNDDVFNGTVWDEQPSGLLNTAVDRVYTDLVTSTPLNAEGRMEAFRGEDPNGTWTLAIQDDAATNVGTLNSWSLDISTIPAPAPATTNFTQSPAIPIPTGAPTTTVGPCAPAIMAVSGVGTYLSSVTCFLQITHTYPGDLDITLTSPAGTVIQITSDNGIGFFDDVFNGTLFSGDAPLAITNAVFADNVLIPLAGPEGALESFRGEDPNGNWTLIITDDLGGDYGSLVRWDLDVTTIAPPTVAGPTSFAGTTGAIPDFTAGVASPTFFTTAVSGVGTSLWDVDLTTFITNTAAADLDITLTSPAGTVVTISTDNGGTNDNVFNGTLWDANANDATTDHVYTNGVTATPLSPEGSLNAFRGEDPNGVWTLTVTDDIAGTDFGDMNAWSLDIAAINSAPVEVLTTTSQSPGLALPVTGIVSDSMLVSGAGASLSSMTLYTEILHTFGSDFSITLTSPLGTVVTVTSNNGGGNDNIYNGTTFDPDSTDCPSDHVYANLTTATPMSPEGSFDNFLGQDPNGLWTLTYNDTAAGDMGTLVRWDLNINTCIGNGQAFCTNSSLGVDHVTACPCGNTGAPSNGCGHSFDANGANIEATGSIGTDTVVLHSQFEPVSSFTLMMQHANAGDTIFHDGVLCAANPLIRLRGRSAVAGEAFFPNSNFAQDSTTTLSIRGGTFPGSGATMRYAAWYRNASSTFCPPSTANVTNGWVITW